jgi:branched-chain amino acid transport system ATP-binding protein
MTPLLEARGLRKSFGGVEAVRGVSFSLTAGERLALIGPNGAGKTTCFNLLNGQLRPDAGSVRLGGRELVGLPPREVWRLGVGRTFQIAQTFRSMTVVEGVQTVLLSRARRLFSILSPGPRLHRDEAMALLARVGVAALAERPAADLAYGDVKRVELALALAGGPRLLLMDEPTAGMAPAERGELMALVSDLARGDGVGVLFTEHDMDVVFNHADRVIVLDRGGLIADAPPGEVRADRRVQEVYLGVGAAGGGTP